MCGVEREDERITCAGRVKNFRECGEVFEDKAGFDFALSGAVMRIRGSRSYVVCSRS